MWLRQVDLGKIRLRNLIWKTASKKCTNAVVDPGFPVGGGIDLVRGMPTPKAVMF